MRGTVRLFKLFGINVYLHWSFIFLIFYLMYVTYSRHADIRSFFTLLALVLIIFACVVMHEYGHALAARRYGIATHDITILPIGGVARLTHIPKNPAQELVVVIAGPAVNLAIFLLLTLLAVGFFHYRPTIEGVFIDDEDLELTRLGALVVGVANANLFLMLFNLVPAFPMDGGRIFRALMCFTMPRPRATFIASLIGRAFAIVIFGFALYNPFNPGEEPRPMLALLAVAVFISARNEYKQVRSEDRFENTKVNMVMIESYGVELLPTEYFVETDANETLKSVCEKMNVAQTKFGIVKNQNQVVGTINFDDILKYINS